MTSIMSCAQGGAAEYILAILQEFIGNSCFPGTVWAGDNNQARSILIRHFRSVFFMPETTDAMVT